MTRTLLLLAAIALTAAGCTTDPDFPAKPITVTVSGLPSLGSQANYRLWFSYPDNDVANIKSPSINHGDASYFSVGTFRIDAAGAMVSTDGTAPEFSIPDGYNPNLITDAILTVEPTDGNDTVPGARILAGTFTGTASQAVATLTLTNDDAFGSALMLDSTFRPFFLDTPTTPEDADFAKGIWFGIYLNGSVTESLVLPELPVSDENPDWIYESWLVHQPSAGSPEYISLGQFLHSGKSDSDGPGTSAGSDVAGAYSIPGEDFVSGVGARTLTDGTYSAAVSLQPSNIQLDRPLITLFGSETIPGDAAQYTTIPLTPRTSPQVEIKVDR